MSGSDARALSRSLLDLCRMRKLTIATAESCTGGLVAGALTDIPGSSDVIDRGFVTYSNDAKRAMLGVKATTLATFGAVSKETATAMAIGALEKAGVDLAVSITGIAGPGGATPGKPVGLVHFAVASRDGKILHREFRFGAIGRTTVRQRSVVEALRMLMELARGPQPPVKPRREADEPVAPTGGANAAAQRRQAAPAAADVSQSTLRRQRLGARFAQRAYRRQCFRADRKFDDGRQAASHGFIESAREVFGALDMGAKAAAGAGKRREVGVGQIGAGDTAGIGPLLMHPDGAVHAVVADDHDQRQPVFDRGHELQPGHLEAAVAGERDDRALGMLQLGGDGRGQAIAHRTRGRREFGADIADSARTDAPRRHNCRRRCR